MHLRSLPQPAWLALALGLTVVALAQRLLWVSAISDDGLTLANAAAVAAGQTPYRDFFLATPPGVVALYGALFKLTGIAYLPARLLTASAVLLSVAAVWDAGRRVTTARAAGLAAALYGTWTATFLFYEPHHFWSMTLPYGMGWALVRARAAARPRAWALAAGLLGGGAMLSDQTSVVPLAAGLVAAAVYLGVGEVAAFAAAASAVGVATLGWAVASGVMGDLWREAVVYPATVFRGLNPVPSPYLPVRVGDLGPPVYSPLPLEKLVVWLAGFAGGVAVCAAAIAALVRARRVRPELGIVLVVSAGIEASVLLARPTGPFLWMAAAFNLVLAAVALSAVRRLAAILPAAGAAALVLALAPLVQAVPAGCGPGGDGSRTWIPVVGGSVCVERSESASLSSAVTFGRDHRQEGVAYLAIITPSYALAGEVPPVAYVWVAPDDTAPAELDRLEAELANPRVGWVISAPRIASADLHPGSAERAPDGRWTLDVYLEEKFAVVGRCGEWELLRPRDRAVTSTAPCAATPST